ncbi:MAG: hypothetical protein HGA47_10115 [Zoogloea sp.]|nr:hypothetical protein [Zoogloea sp.]
MIRTASGVEQAGVYAERFGLQVADLGSVLNKQGDVATELLRASIAAAEGSSGIAEIIANYGGSASDMADVYSKLVDVRSALKGIGASAMDVTPALIRGAGGLDSLQSALSAYQDKFLTDSERLAAQQANLAAQFARLGLSVPASTEDFRSLVEGIDTTTEAGQSLLGKVLGLSDAFATVEDSFSTLRTSLKDLVDSALSSIADVRASTASSTQDITGKPTYTAAGLRTQIAAAVSGLTLPSTAAIETASRNVSAANATVAAKQAAVSAATAHQAEQQQATAVQLANYQAARGTADTKLAAFKAILDNPGMVSKDSNFTERKENYDTGVSYAAHNYWTINGSTAANNSAYAAYSSAFASALKEYRNWQAAAAQSASAAAATKTAQDALATANTNASAAQAAYSKAQDAYATAIKGYVGDAQKATDALSKLREETVAYYQQQEQLANAMNASAANLRKTLDGLATANLSPTAKLEKLQAQYDQAYAATLTASGADLATKSDALNALISPLLDAARGVYASGAGYQQLLDAITRQASGLAGRLETSAPHDYQAESVALLSGIDAALAGLQANLQSADQAVVAAITAQTDAQVQILSDIRALLAGQTLPGHADGLSWVPYDGYRAELHYGEAVLDASTMAGLRKYGIQPQVVVPAPRISVPKMAPMQMSAQPTDARADRQTLDELRAQTRELQALVRQNGAGLPAMLERLEKMERRLYSIERGLRQEEARA